MRLHVTGATGYLGSELVRLRPDTTTERVEVRDAAAVSELFERLRPDVVIHTAYRQDEDDVNTVGSENVARAAAAVGARLVHLSTDVVFDGRKGAPYVEGDLLSPVTTTAAPRRKRKCASRSPTPTRCSCGRRCSYGGATPSKHELSAHDPDFTFFTNEIRSPVQVADLAQALLELAELDVSGPLHVAGADDVSRAEFAELIARGPVRSAPAPETRPLDCCARLRRGRGRSCARASAACASARLVVLEPLGDRLVALRCAVRQGVDLEIARPSDRSTARRTCRLDPLGQAEPKSSAGRRGWRRRRRHRAWLFVSYVHGRCGAFDLELEDALRLVDVLQPPLAEREDRDAVRQRRCRRVRASCPRAGRGRPCRRCTVGRRGRRRGRGSPRSRPPARRCGAHPDLDGAAVGPLVHRVRALGRDRRLDRVPARGNAKKNASPCVSISTPPRSVNVSRISRRWLARTAS